MDQFDNPFDTLSFDEKLISDQVGMSYSNDYSRPSMSVNNRVRLQMREKAMIRNEIRREISRERAKPPPPQPVRETFVGGLRQARSDTSAKDHGYPHGSELIEGMGYNDKETSQFDNKVLMVLVFILAAFCVVQWLNQQSMNSHMNDMMSAMCQMVKGPVVAPPPVRAVRAAPPTT